MPRRPRGGPFGARSPSEMIFDDFWSVLRSIWGARRDTLGVIWEAGSQIGAMMLTFLCSFSGVGKRNENGAPQGVGHAIRSCRRMFREDRPLLPWLHYGLHFGVVLAPEFVTILLLGRPGHQQGPTIGRSEGFPRTGYFVPACVGSGSWADFESCSRIHACGFRCFCRKVWFRARGSHIS